MWRRGGPDTRWRLPPRSRECSRSSPAGNVEPGAILADLLRAFEELACERTSPGAFGGCAPDIHAVAAITRDAPTGAGQSQKGKAELRLSGKKRIARRGNAAGREGHREGARPAATLSPSGCGPRNPFPRGIVDVSGPRPPPAPGAFRKKSCGPKSLWHRGSASTGCPLGPRPAGAERRRTREPASRCGALKMGTGPSAARTRRSSLVISGTADGLDRRSAPGPFRAWSAHPPEPGHAHMRRPRRERGAIGVAREVSPRGRPPGPQAEASHGRRLLQKTSRTVNEGSTARTSDTTRADGDRDRQT